MANGEAPRRIDTGWRLYASAPDAWRAPGDIPRDAEWIPAVAPGTVAGALRAAGRLDDHAPEELDDRDWWIVTEIEGVGAHVLCFDGLATIAEVYLDEAPILKSDNMYVAREVAVDLDGAHVIAICCRALAPSLARPAKRARWRPKLASPQTLRLHRTTFLGRMGGWQPPMHAIGPWRPVSLRKAGPRVAKAELTARLEGADGALDARLVIEGLEAPFATLHCGDARAQLARVAPGEYRGAAIVRNARPWWPHTHGKPSLYNASARIGDHLFDLGRVGFRTVEIDRDADGEGFALVINGERVFCRGALWTTTDLATLAGGRADHEPLLRRMVDANMNMVRVGGTTVYESDAFYELCDELGLLVWQDFMFSNFDYPASDPAFVASVEAEANDFLARTRASPSVVILCGASEVAQQAAMMGLPAPTWTNSLFEETLRAAARTRPDVAYIAHTPFGGALPFEPRRGVCHYYGVSAYMRPIEDARAAGVRFAGECLGFANVPECSVELEPDRAAIVQPCWGERHENDVGATWFFEGVRNHYLTTLFGVDVEAIRHDDPARYLELSRAVNAHLMEGVFALWRRAGSPTAGGLVWFLRDVVAGAGFGVIASDGAPKSVWWALKRAFRPTQVILTDEGLNGLDAHVIHEGDAAIEARLSLTCLREGATPVMRAERALTLAPRSAMSMPATELWGGFFDTAYAYRFGPPSHDVTVARLTAADGRVLSEAFHFPLGLDGDRHEIGLRAGVVRDDEGWVATIASDRLARFVHIDLPGFEAADNWFHLAPGVERRVALKQVGDAADPRGVIRAVNGLDIARIGGAA